MLGSKYYFDPHFRVNQNDDADGVDSPYRLYNRRSSFVPAKEYTDNSDDTELQVVVLLIE